MRQEILRFGYWDKDFGLGCSKLLKISMKTVCLRIEIFQYLKRKVKRPFYHRIANRFTTLTSEIHVLAQIRFLDKRSEEKSSNVFWCVNKLVKIA